MPLNISPGIFANSFEAAVVRELGHLRHNGYLAHNVLLPNVRDRCNPNEHDVILLMPEVAFTIDAKEYDRGEYRIPVNSSIEWRKLLPEKATQDGGWRLIRQMPNPFYIAFQKAKVLHGMLTRIDRTFEAYRIESLIVVPDHAVIQPVSQQALDKTANIEFHLVVSLLSELVKNIEIHMASPIGGKKLSERELHRIFSELQAIPRQVQTNIEICGIRLETEIDRVERGCPLPVKFFRGIHDLSNHPVEVRLYRKWPWNRESDRFLARAQRRLNVLFEHPMPGIPHVVESQELPDLVILASVWYEGESIDALVKRRGPLAPPLVRSLLKHISNTVNALHELDIVHLDIRPEHILIAPNLDQHEGNQHQITGFTNPLIDENQLSTQAYDDHYDASFAGPEMQVHRHPDRGKPTNDIFSIGRLAAYCLCGDSDYRRRLASGGIDLTGIDPAFSRIIRRATSFSCAARHRTADELITELA